MGDAARFSGMSDNITGMLREVAVSVGRFNVLGDVVRSPPPSSATATNSVSTRTSASVNQNGSETECGEEDESNDSDGEDACEDCCETNDGEWHSMRLLDNQRRK
tara:strand:+ start:24159 stop:24473 length:315 start_codon:yes stop_codon:yes gene_type:complete